MLAIDQPAPDFELTDLDGSLHRLSDFRGRIVVVNFWSAECPWSERADGELLAELGELAEPVVLLSITSNANETDEMLRQAFSHRHIPILLLDPGARVADMFEAQTTPHAFVVDRSGVLRYQGAINDVTFRQRTPSHWYVAEALQALLAGRLPETPQVPPYGCTIVRGI
jgi:peroxiredoxin